MPQSVDREWDAHRTTLAAAGSKGRAMSVADAGECAIGDVGGRHGALS
jgi:hypothetical protein